ncbi:MAG: hypothetical protein ABH818_03220 [Patescibacteria group bacterium]|nr:hypothetical protein [Patescibacteria group bacterium]
MKSKIINPINLKKITIPIIIILIIGLFLVLFIALYYYEKSKEIQSDLNYSEEINKKLSGGNKDMAQKSIPIDLSYNQRTGELFPIFPDDIIPSVCVWTLWGQQSDSIVVTRAGDDGLFYNYNENKDEVYYAYPYSYNNSNGEVTYDKNNGKFIGFSKYDWIGHLINNEIKVIKDNNLLPPRAPIYVTCVDSQNRSYYGAIGEYEQ